MGGSRYCYDEEGEGGDEARSRRRWSGEPTSRCSHWSNLRDHGAHTILSFCTRGFGTLTSSHRAAASTSVFLSLREHTCRIQDASDTCKGCRILLKRHVRYFWRGRRLEGEIRDRTHTRPLFFHRYFRSSRIENHFFFFFFWISLNPTSLTRGFDIVARCRGTDRQF